ncbi:MAG: hypothetical protein IOC52_06340 [Methylobacterium sp.]|nr:hypothetical protein [Methylobacterium sp.]MCA3623781.1 hypothetical protein [Methylobacterium sp.]
MIELIGRAGSADIVPALDGLVRQPVCDRNNRSFKSRHLVSNRFGRGFGKRARRSGPDDGFPKHSTAVEASEMDREIVEIVGFFAAGMTVTAFYCKSMLTLRVAAIFANLLFIIYGSGLDLKPVLALHCVLLPINIMRLITVMLERRKIPSRDVYKPRP